MNDEKDGSIKPSFPTIKNIFNIQRDLNEQKKNLLHYKIGYLFNLYKKLTKRFGGKLILIY